MPLLVLLELLVVFELMHADIGSLDRVDWEEVKDVIIILLDGHSETLLEHEVKSVRLLNELDTAIWSIFLHSLDKHGGLFCLFFELVLRLLLLNIVFQLLRLAQIHIFLSLLSCLACFHVSCRDRLENGDVEGRLPLLVQHEEMVRQVSQLGLKRKPVCFIAHELMHSCIAIWIDTVVMRVYQVALNMRKSLHLDTTHFLGASSWAHRRVFSTIDELTNDENGHDSQVLGETDRR